MRLAGVQRETPILTVVAAVRAGVVVVLYILVTRLIGTSLGAHAWETETAGSLADALVEIPFFVVGSLFALVPFSFLVMSSTHVAARWTGPRAREGFVAFWALLGALVFAMLSQRPGVLPLLRGAFVAGSVAAAVASHRLTASDSPGRRRWGRGSRAVALGSLIVVLIVARAIRPPIELLPFGHAWKVSTPISNGLAIESGSSSSHRLYRYNRGVHYRVATGVRIWGEWGPDCVLYAGRDPWAVCGNRFPARVGSEHDPAWRWFLERYGEVSPEKLEEHMESVIAAMKLAETQPIDPRYRPPPTYRAPEVVRTPGS